MGSEVSARFDNKRCARGDDSTHSSLQDRDDVSLDIGQLFAPSWSGNTHVTNESGLGDDSTSETGIVTEEDDTVMFRKNKMSSMVVSQKIDIDVARASPMTETTSRSETHPM
jgi:hypothetical protein